MTTARTRALLVADAPGHIIARIAASWQRHARGVDHSCLNSGANSSYSICRRARALGVVHWIDHLAYETLGGAVRAAQVVMAHHLTPERLERGVAALRRCDAITTSSALWQGRLEALTGRPVTRIPYSIDTGVFRPAPDRHRLRQAAGIGPRRFVAGFLGKAGANQDNRKGIDLLETVVAAAAKRIKDFSFVLVGPGWEPLALRLGQRGVNVLHLQYRSTEETAAAYSLMDATLVTSSEEGGPCTILEAMACEVPVVTSMVGHVPEVVDDGRTGLICPSRSAREYLDRLEALASDLVLRRRIARDAALFIARERADDVVIPRIDFGSLYACAAKRYRERTCAELTMRMLPSAYLCARSLARPFFRSAAMVNS